MQNSLKVVRLSISSPIPEKLLAPEHVRDLLIICFDSRERVDAFWKTVAQRNNTVFGSVQILKGPNEEAFDLICSVICEAANGIGYEIIATTRATFRKTGNDAVGRFLENIESGKSLAIAIGYPVDGKSRITKNRLIFTNPSGNIPPEHRQLVTLAAFDGENRQN